MRQLNIIEDTPVTVGVFGHYGNENLGDEAIIEAVIQSIRARWRAARIVGFSVNVVDTARRYAIDAYPIRKEEERAVHGGTQAPSAKPPPEAPAAANRAAGGFKAKLKRLPLFGYGLRLAGRLLRQAQEVLAEAAFLKRSFHRLSGVDLLLVCGSNQFLDNFGGPWAFPYTLLKWSILAKLRRAKLAYISVGAGPIDSPLSRTLVRLALLCSDYTSFRDPASKRLIETKLFRDLGSVSPDLAHGLALETRAAPAQRNPTTRPVVGINPMPVYDPRYWCEVDANRYLAYVEKLARFASVLLREGFPVFFFPTQPKDENVINDVLARLDEDMRGQIKPGDVRRGGSVYGLMDIYASADIVVATRFHGTLLALLAERPVLGICYYRKTRDLLREMGQEDYAVDLDGLDVADLLSRFRTLLENRARAQADIQLRNQEYRAALEAQYRQVFSLIRRGQVVADTTN